MSSVAGRIIVENYDSVVAAETMKESLERLDSAALFELIGQHERAIRQATEHRARFNAAFDKAQGNITEIGEADVIAAIGRGRDDYLRTAGRVPARVRPPFCRVFSSARTAFRRDQG